MGQHRTKKEKEKAVQLRLKEVERDTSLSTKPEGYQFVDDTGSSDKSGSLLKIDSHYIIQDLIKTVSISAILLSIVIGIYFYLRYN